MRLEDVWLRYRRGGPWVLRSVTVALGLWAHLLALPAAVALGALASRAITRSAGYGVAVLALGVVLALVLGVSGPVLGWLAPPLLPTARALAGSVPPATGVLLTGWASAWAAVVLAGYVQACRRRA